MTELRLINLIPQLRKQQHWQSDDDDNNNPNLRLLCLPNVHIDYVEEFLHDNNSCLPRLKQL
jgi:hypothetical protein